MSSSSSSSTESGSPPSPSSTLSNFDPFAVHPFTNCSQATQSNIPKNSPYGYAYPSNINHTGVQQPQSQTTHFPVHPNSSTRSPTIPYGYTPRPAGIFEPFTKDASIPELGDVLKKTSTPSNTAGNPAKPIPISRKY